MHALFGSGLGVHAGKMLPQAKAFLDESDALYALVLPLSEKELSTKTAFKGWSISDVVGHLYIWNWAANLTLTDSGAFQAFWQEVMVKAPKLGSLNGFEKAWLSEQGFSGRALVKVWHEHYLQTAQNFGSADPSKRVKWAGPDMTVRSKITARLMETWAHGQEVYDQLGLVRKNRDHIIENIVRLGVNTYGWTFAVRQLKPPGPLPHLKLTSPSGHVWLHGEPSETDCVEGAAEEFCQVVTQTRNIADTELKVTGATAQSWMEKAQCFAGGPETPPAPGTRKMMAKL